MQQLKEFPDYYVTMDGRVYSTITNKYLKGGEDKNGYIHVVLRLPKEHPDFKFKKYKTCKIHVLVAKTFIQNPNQYPCINHIDGNKHNNNVSNLEWCTYAYNNKHAILNGLRKQKQRKITNLSEILNDFLTGEYTVKELEIKYNWHTSANFVGTYLHEYAKEVGKEQEYLKVKSSLKKKAASLGTEAIKKPVQSFTVNGQFLKSFTSQAEAARYYKVSIHCINSCCKHKTKIPKIKIIFRYVNEPF